MEETMLDPTSKTWKELWSQMAYVEKGYERYIKARSDYIRTGLRSDKLYAEDVWYNYQTALRNVNRLLERIAQSNEPMNDTVK